MHPASANVGRIHHRFAFNRNLLSWSHIWLGAIPAFTLLSYENPCWVRSAGRTAGTAMIVMATTMLLPFVYSLVHTEGW